MLYDVTARKRPLGDAYNCRDDRRVASASSSRLIFKGIENLLNKRNLLSE